MSFDQLDPNWSPPARGSPRESLEESTPVITDARDLHVPGTMGAGRSLRRMPAAGLRVYRKERYPEMFRHAFVRELIDNPPKPMPDVQNAHADIIGGEPQFLLRLHPLLKRWTEWEWIPKHEAYVPFSIYWDASTVREDYLPEDLAHLPHLRGLVGDLRVPTREDFSMIREVDLRQGVDAVDSILEADVEKIEAEKERVLRDREYDVVDYNYLLINRAANGGARMYSFPDGHKLHDEKTNPERWVVEQRNGYTVRYRRRGKVDKELLGMRIQKVLDDPERQTKENRLERSRAMRADEAQRAGIVYRGGSM